MESKRAAEIRNIRGKWSANGMQKEVLNDTDYFSDDELSTSDGRCDSTNKPKNNESFVTTTDDTSDVAETLNELRREERKYCMETAQPVPSANNLTDKEETCDSANKSKNNKSFMTTADDLSDGNQTQNECDSANQPKNNKPFMTKADDLSDVVETLNQLRREERKYCMDTAQPAPPTNNVIEKEETCDSANKSKNNKSFMTTADDLSDGIQTQNELCRDEKYIMETAQLAPSTKNVTEKGQTCDSANQPKNNESFVTTVDDLSDVVETLNQLRKEEEKYCMETAQPAPSTENVTEKEETLRREERKNFLQTAQPAPSTSNLTAEEETCGSVNQPKKNESFVTTVDDLSDVVETLNQLRREERKNFLQTAQPAPSTSNLTAEEETCGSVNQPKQNESFVTTADDLSDIVETLNQLRREERKNPTAQPAPSTSNLTEKEETNDPETDDNHASVSALDVYNELRNKLLLKQAPNILEEVTDGDQSEKLELLAEIIAREQNSNMSEEIQDKDYIQTQESTSKLSVGVKNEDYIKNKQSISKLLVEIADEDHSTLIAFYYFH